MAFWLLARHLPFGPFRLSRQAAHLRGLSLQCAWVARKNSSDGHIACDGARGIAALSQPSVRGRYARSHCSGAEKKKNSWRSPCQSPSAQAAHSAGRDCRSAAGPLAKNAMEKKMAFWLLARHLPFGPFRLSRQAAHLRGLSLQCAWVARKNSSDGHIACDGARGIARLA